MVGLLASAQFIMVLDTTVMNVSISQVVSDLHTTVVGLQTAITLYTLVMASLMLIGGKLGERWGAKKTFAAGLLVYGTGSLITSVSPNLAVLLLGWSLIEGLGAVLVIPAIAALTAATYQGKQRAVAYGILGGVSGASMAAGPLIGGWVSAEYSWRYVFAAESAVVVVILLFRRIVPTVQGHLTKLDTSGAVLSALGLGSIVLGILRSSQWGWITPNAGVPEINGHPFTPLGLSPTLWLIVIGSVVLVVFGRRERKVKDRGDEPLLDLALLKIPRMRAGLVVQWCQAFIIQATFFVLPLYLQTVLGFDSLKTGVTILPMSAGMFIFALGGSALTGRYSPKQIVQPGIAAMLVGEVVLLYFLDPQLNGWGFGIGLALLGAGLGLLASQVGNVIMSSVDPKRGGEAGGLQGTRSTSAPRSASPSWDRSSWRLLRPTSLTRSNPARRFPLRSSSRSPKSPRQAPISCPRPRSNRPPNMPACHRPRPRSSWPPTPTPSSRPCAPPWRSSPSSRCSHLPGYAACPPRHPPKRPPRPQPPRRLRRTTPPSRR